MQKLFLLRALDLIARYTQLYAECRCVDKIERAKLFSDSMNLVEDVEAHNKKEGE